jgi:signal transduction histidine kinase
MQASPHRRKSWPRAGGLFGKYVVAFVGLVVFVLAVNAALELWLTYRDTKSALISTQSEKATTAAHRVDQSISEIMREVSWATRASSDTTERRRVDYALLLQQVPLLGALMHLDGEGKEDLKVSRQDVVVGEGNDYSREPAFTQALARGVWFGPAYFRGDSKPYMLAAMAHSARSAGVTVAEIDLSFLADVVKAIPAGTRGYAYIVTAQGRLLAQSDMGRAARNTDMSELPQVAALRTPQAAPVTIGRNLEGTSVLTVSAPSSRVDATVFVEQPVTEAFAPMFDVLYRSLLLLALGLAVSVLAGVVQARRMIVPIRALQAGASRLGASDFSHRIDVRTGDEIEELADKFNTMSSQLQESYSRLEHKVAERTRDLARSVRELKGLEEIGRAVASSLDFKAVLATIVTRAVELLQADAGAIYSFDPAKRAFILSESIGLDKTLASELHTIPIDTSGSAMSAAAKRYEPVLIPDLAASSDFPLREQVVAAGFNSVLVVPLVGTAGVLGALVVQHRSKGDFASDRMGLIRTFADQSVLAMHNARLFREVEEKGRQLAIANEHQSRFFANMSHELRTPLNAVLGYAELLADGLYGEMPEKAAEILARIQANGKHLLALINEVLDFSKMEAGQLTLQIEDYSMRTVIDSVVATTKSLADAKGLALTTSIADDLPRGRGDERRLVQVFLNIVSNAIKFTDVGSVEIRAQAVDGHFDVAVHDTGPGISAEDQTRVFEEFQQVDNSATRRKGGTGLGLAIAKRLVGMHGGNISLHSAPGDGSTFRVIVPVRADEAGGRA